MNVYPNNVEWSGKIIDEDIDFTLSLGENSGIYIKGDMMKVDEDFLNMMDSNPVLRNGIIKELSRELSDRADFITNMAQKSVRERLAFTMIILLDIYEKEPINLSREDLANFVGTATETLIRLLKDFKEEGIIEVHTRKISVLNREKLFAIAGK